MRGRTGCVSLARSATQSSGFVNVLMEKCVLYVDNNGITHVLINKPM